MGFCVGAVLWWNSAVLEQCCARAVQDLTVLARRSTSLWWNLAREIDHP
mgnify:CR=1 FL=1